MARIGVDMDGTVYNFVKVLKSYAEVHWGYKDLPTPEVWDFYKHQWGWTSEEFFEIYGKGVLHGVIWSHGKPMEDSKKFINRLYDEGHKIHVVTHRTVPGYVGPLLAQVITEEWLSANQIKHHSVTVSADKSSVPVDYFIEDNADNYLSLKNCGVNAVLIDRPYNRYLTDATRVADWSEFYTLITTMENNQDAQCAQGSPA